MIYWDTSALVPLFVAEAESKKARQWLQNGGSDPRFTSWLTIFELESVVRRKHLQKKLTKKELEQVQNMWADFQATLNFVPLDARTARIGAQLQKAYALRSYDSIHVGSLSLLSLEHSNVRLACFDEKLNQVARLEGISVL